MSKRTTPLHIPKSEFKEIGYQLVDTLAEFLDDIGNSPVTTQKSYSELKELLGNQQLPERGVPSKELLEQTADLLINNSLFNGHPKFMGYITSSPTPIGILGDLLASAMNPNVGAQILSPVATEIEKQTIAWLCDFIGVPNSFGGVLVSGGNMANLTAFAAARNYKVSKNFKQEGVSGLPKKMIAYCPKTTHTWIEKAASLFGHGSDSVNWIDTNEANQMDNKALQEAIENDLQKGHQPFMVVGTAGDVSTGVVDDLNEIAAICNQYDLWFHVDGAYGAPAAVLPELAADFNGLADADSIALDPHKWLYSPLEAGCTLVKNPKHLVDTYSSHPDYYHFDAENQEHGTNFYEFGFQNSRGFRALKVWLALKQVGKSGYQEMIREDIELAQYFFELAKKHPELEAVTHHLSLTTLRFVSEEKQEEKYLNELNEKLVERLQSHPEMFLSNAIVKSKYCLRGCIVNFRTSRKDIEEIIEIIVREGRKLHMDMSSQRAL